MKIFRVSVDLAKNVFRLHGIDRQGEKVLKRDQFSKGRKMTAPFGLTQKQHTSEGKDLLLGI